MKTQHLNPEFGHTWGEIQIKKKNLQRDIKLNDLL
jgi:hypothetical protein